jgi:membrane-associated protein
MKPGSFLYMFYNFLSVFDIEALIRYGGLFMLCLLVYGSTGLFFCFFLPSGAVLFAAGIYAATGELHDNIFFICSLLIISSVLGNITGYWFGKQAGPPLYRRKDSKFFKRQYLIKTEEFYNKYGKLALAAGFFLPIIRTFSPIVAGITRMNFRRFISATVAGSVTWILSFVLAGYFIGSQPFLKPWLKYMVIGFLLVVTVPLIIRIVREFKKSGKEKEDES